MLSNKIFAPPLDQAMLADELAQDRRGQKIEPPQPNDVVLTAKLAAYPKSSTPIAELLTPGSTILPQEIEAASPVKNLAFVYFVYPKLTDVSGPLDYPDHLNLPGSGQAGRDIPIIDLARPDLFPQLYQPTLLARRAPTSPEPALPEIASIIARPSSLKALVLPHHGGPTPCTP